jgi:HEAT repeat protein
VGRAAAVPALKEALKDPVPSVRVQAAKALGRAGDASAVPDLLHALHHADEQLGSQIFLALVQLGHAAVPALIRASESRSAWVRWQCIRALSEIRDRRALPVLVQALRDNDHAVAWMAAKGLVRAGQWAVEPVLNLLLTTEAFPWLVETTSYVLHNLYVQNDRLKPYLVPVIQSMRGAAYQIAIPLSARKALAQLQSDGLIASH